MTFFGRARCPLAGANILVGGALAHLCKRVQVTAQEGNPGGVIDVSGMTEAEKAQLFKVLAATGAI